MPVPSTSRKRKSLRQFHVRDLRAKLRHVLNSVERDGERVEVLRYNEVVAVIVPVADYAAFTEKAA